jgi:hypothetical protein
MNFENEPSRTGIYDGTLTDYKDLGLVRTRYGQLRKVILSFKVRSKDKSHQIDRCYTYSLDPRSHLARDISSLLGHTPSPDFNPKDLIGTSCQLHLNIETHPGQINKVRILGIFPAQPRDSGLLDGFSIEIRKHPIRDL